MSHEREQQRTQGRGRVGLYSQEEAPLVVGAALRRAGPGHDLPVAEPVAEVRVDGGRLGEHHAVGVGKVEVDVLGLIENMSYYDCQSCNKRHQIFGEGGGKAISRRLDIPFLGEIPINERICSGGDCGSPVGTSNADERGIFDALADRVLSSLQDASDL